VIDLSGLKSIAVDPQAQVALSMFGEAQKLIELTRISGRTKAH